MAQGNSRPGARQQGFALLVTLLVLVIGAATLFVGARLPTAGADALDPAISRRLSDARDAVVAYAQFGGANNKPGALPCPDTRDPSDPDAGQTGNHCQGTPNPVYLGRLPTRTVDVPGKSAPPLWYALDGDFQDDPDDPPELNAETDAGLVIQGVDPDGPGVPRVAVLIITGPPLAGQADRPSVDPAAYLEGENADGDTIFRDCAGLDDCNDRVIGIPVDRLFDRIQRRVLAGVERALVNAEERMGTLPWASAFDDASLACESDRRRGRLPRTGGDCPGPDPFVRDDDFEPEDGWIPDNGWDEIVVYEVAVDCAPDQANCGDGDLAIGAEAELEAMLAGAGRPHDDQARPGTMIDDYIDRSENRDNDGVYRDFPLDASDNDVFRGVRIGS